MNHVSHKSEPQNPSRPNYQTRKHVNWPLQVVALLFRSRSMPGLHRRSCQGFFSKARGTMDVSCPPFGIQTLLLSIASGGWTRNGTEYIFITPIRRRSPLNQRYKMWNRYVWILQPILTVDEWVTYHVVMTKINIFCIKILRKKK